MKPLLVPALMLAMPSTSGAIAGIQRDQEPATKEAIPQEVAPFLPAVGVHASRTMVLMMPRQAVAILERMDAALKQRPEWINAWAKDHRDPNGRLQYHPNLGISEEEYLQLSRLEKQMTLGEVERGNLNVRLRPDGGLELSSTGHAAYLNGIVIYPEKDYVDTKHGRLNLRTAINQRDPQSPTGPWRGAQWTDSNGEQGPVVKFAIGKRQSGELVIYYDVEPSSNETLFLIYQ